MGTSALLAIDQGTTSSRAILFSVQGDVLALRQKELTLHYPHKGWVEQDATEILDDTLWACRELVSEAREKNYEIAGIGITNQRETSIVWDKKTGQPIYNAIIWQDRRTADLCAKLKDAGHETMISQKTGLLLDPYFSATKLAWVLDNVEGARAKAESGELAFGTVDSFLLWHLTGGSAHATDATNAARTMLFNIQTQEWDEDLLRLFDIPRAMLPEVHDCVSDFGTSDADLIGQAIPIGGIAGDQQAALIGQGCFDVGMAKSTYGTGCFALVNIGETFIQSKNRLLTTIAYRINGKTTYAIEGSIFVAGAAVQWLRDGLGLFDEAAESETLANSVSDNNGVYFVPAFTGLGAPYWQPEAQGMITGLTRDSTAAHIVRAALEAQAYQTRDLMAAMQEDSGTSLKTLRADGGLVANGFVCQFLSDILQKPLEVPKVHETTAWGAACLAGLHVGVFDGLRDISKQWQAGTSYAPKMSEENMNVLYGEWKNAIKRVLR